MTHRMFLFTLTLSLLLSACGAAASTTEPGTLTDEPSIEDTPIGETTVEVGTAFVITAEVGTVEPETLVPSDQITPVVEPSATSIPPLSGGLSPTELKYAVLTEFPDFFFCDPDYYPVARADEMDLARERFPELQANAEEFNTILAYNNLSGVTSFTDDQILLIYRDHKKLNAIRFEGTGGDSYRFQIQVAKTEGDGELITGVVDANGAITIEQREAAMVMCPICLAADTRIDTPDGPVAVQDLRVGMLVWTLDASGKRVAQPLIVVGSTLVPANHQVVHVVLNDGRELWVSPGHPTADGRTIGDLQAGDSLDGAVVVSAERVLYMGYVTYDVLPAGDTGYYWANGILIASTLKD